MTRSRATWWSVPVLLAGCACGAAPARGAGELRARPGGDERTPRAAVVELEPYGYTVEVTVHRVEWRGDSADRELNELWRGELIGCDPRGIYLLLHEDGDDAEQYLRWNELRDGEVQLEGTSAWSFLGWGLAGVASAASHGILAVASAPLWGAITLITTLAYGLGDPVEAFPIRGRGPDRCCALVRWARFPQGVPPGVAARYRELSAAEAGSTTPIPACPDPPAAPERGPSAEYGE